MLLRSAIISLAAATLVGVAVRAGPARVSTGFRFPAETFAYTNQLAWVYELQPGEAKMTARRMVPKPPYTLHCVPMARVAREFYWHARFEPNEPPCSRTQYQQLVRMVMSRSARRPSKPQDRVVFPGYSNLREFSADYEPLLKEETGGAWQSFLQRGNWRMVFPFSHDHQERTAKRFLQAVHEGYPPLAHIVCFPAQTINHTVLLYAAGETAEGITFDAYDPNRADAPLRLVYDRANRAFRLPQTHYFAGGPLKVYEIFRGFWY